MTTDDPISRAADLAERLVDEVARAHQDWRTVRALAEDLAELAAGLAGGDDEPRRDSA